MDVIRRGKSKHCKPVMFQHHAHVTPLVCLRSRQCQVTQPHTRIPIMSMQTKLFSALALAVSATLSFVGTAAAAPVHNVVLVHGAWVTGAGWKPVYDILVKDGYHVTIAQHPLTSFDADIT